MRSQPNLKMKLHPYELKPRSTLGKVGSTRSRHGALCRFEFADGSTGYSDLHPWHELGDLPLQEQIRLLDLGEMTPLMQGTVRFALLDAEARSQGRSLWNKWEIPPSHFLVTDLENLSPSQLESLARQGFSRLKIKLGPHLEQEVLKLVCLLPEFSQFSFLIRLDFNSTLNRSEFEKFLEALGLVIERIDFIEDPFPYDPVAWAEIQSQWKIRLALDRIPENSFGSSLVSHPTEFHSESFSVLVHKPACQSSEWALRFARRLDVSLVVTSYLNHPVGQLSAAWAAGALALEDPKRIECCGLLSHSVYQENNFSTDMRTQGPFLIPPLGTGMGWDELLKGLSWK